MQIELPRRHWALSNSTFLRILEQTRYEPVPARAGDSLFDPLSAWWDWTLKRHVVPPLNRLAAEAEVCDPLACAACAQAKHGVFVPRVWWNRWCLEWSRVGDAAAHWIATRPQRERQRRLIRLGNAVASMLVKHATRYATVTDDGLSWNGPIAHHGYVMELHGGRKAVLGSWFTTPLVPLFRMYIRDEKAYVWGLARQDGDGFYHHDLGTVLTQGRWIDGPWRSAVIKWLWVVRHLLLRVQHAKAEEQSLEQAQDREREEAWLRCAANVMVPSLDEVVGTT